jgi:ATP/maltotriose-dependent transcriptional regulator MalT
VALLAPALRTLTSFGFVAGAASARLHLGRATALAGDPAEVARLLRETLEQLEATGIGLLALDARAKLVEVLVLAGDHAAARTVLAEARRAERALGTSAFATLLDRVEAVLLVAEDDERAIAHVRDATARARDLGATYDLCVLLSLAEGLGDGGGAEAADIARGLGVVTIPSLASR